MKGCSVVWQCTRTLWIVVASSALACSSTSDPEGAASGRQADGSVTQADGTVAQADVGVMHPDNAPTSWGQLYLYYAHFGAVTPQVSASFGDPNHPQPLQDCTSAAFGDCMTYECPFVGAGASSPDAGPVKLTSSIGTEPVTITPDADGHYPSTLPDVPDFTGGETITFSAPGNAVPAFSESTTYPAPLVVSAPVMPAAPQPATVSRAHDLTLTWTGGEAEISLWIAAQQLGNGTYSGLNCSVPSMKGTLTIPATVLGKLDATHDLQLSTFHAHTFHAGAYEIEIDTAGDATTPDKSRSITLDLE